MVQSPSLRKISLSRTAWDDLIKTSDRWWPWALGFSLAMAMLRLLAPTPVIVAPEMLKAHPFLEVQSLIPLIPVGLAIVALSLISSYVLVITYLQQVITKGPPKLSVEGFFFWFARQIERIFRPILWLLLPFVGVVFYVRSIIRRISVSPMAALRRPDIMERSWSLSEGNVWRILWHVLVLDVKIGFFAFIASIVLGIVISIGTFFVHGNFVVVFSIVSKLLNGAFFGIFSTAHAVYGCNVYRVLLKERKDSAVSPVIAST